MWGPRTLNADDDDDDDMKIVGRILKNDELMSDLESENMQKFRLKSDLSLSQDFENYSYGPCLSCKWIVFGLFL